MSEYVARDLPDIPQSAVKMTLDIVNGVFLGASRNIRMINDVFCLIVEDSTNNNIDYLIQKIFETAEFFIRTRGKNTPVIANSINMILDGLKTSQVHTRKDLLNEIKLRRDNYNKNSLLNKSKISQYGANLLSQQRNIFTFDYSSSMLGILDELGKRKMYKHLLIAESRDLDGGRPIIREISEQGHTADFIIDIAMLHYFPQLDAIIFGAETINIDGSCYNTVGSSLVSKLASIFNKPLFIASELAKIDTETINGNFKGIKEKDYRNILDPNSELSGDIINFKSKDLDLVPSQEITSYITEYGIIPPGAILQEAIRHKII
jgi:ribose 1,5-bisphosphate isomerase